MDARTNNMKDPPPREAWEGAGGGELGGQKSL